MKMSYSKLHSSIVNSSLWTQADSVRVLFVTLLAIADREGYIYGSKIGLSRIANIKADDIDFSFSTLLLPDPDSCDLIRSPENEGKRLEEISGGFRLLNYEYYRGLRDDDERREQNKQAQKRFRDKQSATVSNSKPASAKVTQGQKIVSPAEAEADAVSQKHSSRKSSIDEFFEKSYKQYPRHTGKPAALKAWLKAIKKHNGEMIYQQIIHYAKVCERYRKPKEYTPHLSTWLNDERFMDDPSEWAVISNGNGKTSTEMKTVDALADLDRRRNEKRQREAMEHPE